EQRPGEHQRDCHRHHEYGGRENDRLAEQARQQRALLKPALAHRVDREEHDQRPELETEPDERRLEFLPVDLFRRLGFFARHQSLPAIAAAKSSALNVSILSAPSPTPMKCTGRPNLRAMATRMPPRAVPSSLVMTRPVTPARLPKISTWLRAFCPVVASRVRRVACGAAGSTFLMTRMIFSSSPINSSRFCSRPAVSMSRTSAASSLARVTASKARAEASEPAGRATTGAPVRSPQTSSCSMAAARKVSPAASMTFLP